jgi:hypothetical protein
MGSIACCQGQTGDATAGEVIETANRPQRKDMAEPGFDIAVTSFSPEEIKGAVQLQAALRGYLARRLFARSSFTPYREDIVDYSIEFIPDFSNDRTRVARRKLGDYSIKELPHLDVQLYEFTPVHFSDNSVYAGEWTRSSLREGRGVLYKPDGEVYEGQWYNDRPHGKGRLIMRNGDVYIGEFYEGTIHGYGKYTSLEGYSYEGGWANNAKHGSGRDVFSDGTVYEGEFFYGARNGHGVFYWNDGRRFDGIWKDDNIEGYGILTYAEGRQNEGPWSHGKLHGIGKVTENGLERGVEWNQGRRVKWLS